MNAFHNDLQIIDDLVGQLLHVSITINETNP